MDYQYWNDYYKKNIAPNEPSRFAQDIIGYLEDGKTMIELGCGNGRDAIFFAKNKINVIAIDQSQDVINNLKNKISYKNIEFISDDFIKTKILQEGEYDYVYSRFTIHSISEEQEDILLDKVYNILKEKGMFFIEVRSVKDDIYGLGKKVGKNTYMYNKHTRRFIVLEELIKKLKSVGFEIIIANESKNYAVYKNENPIVIRIIVKK